MNYKKAKLVLLAVVPLILAALMANVGQQRRAERAKSATRMLLSNLFTSPEGAAALVAQGADVNAYDGNGRTALHNAASSISMLDVAKVLLDRGADINAQDRLGATPLIYGARAENVPCVRLFLQRGADVNAKGVKGPTALLVAENTLAEAVHFTPAAAEHGVDTHEDISNLREVIQLLKAAGAKE